MAGRDTDKIKEADNWDRGREQFHFNCTYQLPLFSFVNSFIYFQIAAEVSAPLAKTDEIVLIGGQDRTTAEVRTLLSSTE